MTRGIRLSALTLLLAGAAACGSGAKDQTATSDSALARDKTLLPADTTQPINDPAPSPAATPAPVPTATAAKPKPKPAAPKPAASAPVAATPAPAPTPAVAPAGTSISAKNNTKISSATNKAGEQFEATISNAVTSASGRTVIPAGAVVTLSIVKIHESENKSDNLGTLDIRPVSVLIDGKSYPIDATVTARATVLEGKSTNVGDVAKVGAGAGAGAIVGKIIGGGKGALIGGVVGGAVGTQRAIETKDRNTVLPEGAAITIKLDSDFSRS